MIDIKEALVRLGSRHLLDNDVIELITHLQAENDLLKTTLYEIKKHETGVNALKVALARVRELEIEFKDKNNGNN